MAKVFVILLNWNGWRDTVKCIVSLKGLSYPNYEIVVLDNASTNDSVEQIRAAHPDVTLIETGANLGFAGGNNVGIRYALSQGADYIWLLNNDTVVFPNTLSSMIEVAQSDLSVGAVGSPIYEMSNPEKLQTWGGGYVNLWTGVAKRCPAGGKPHYLTGASLLVRRAVFESIGLLDEEFFMYWEDVDFSLRLGKAGWKVVVAPGGIVLHAESASVGKKSPKLDKMYTQSSLLFIDRHSRFPVLAKTISVCGRLAKRLIKLDWSGFQAILAGLSDKNHC